MVCVSLKSPAVVAVGHLIAAKFAHMLHMFGSSTALLAVFIVLLMPVFVLVMIRADALTISAVIIVVLMPRHQSSTNCRTGKCGPCAASAIDRFGEFVADSATDNTANEHSFRTRSRSLLIQVGSVVIVAMSVVVPVIVAVTVSSRHMAGAVRYSFGNSTIDRFYVHNLSVVAVHLPIIVVFVTRQCGS